MTKKSKFSKKPSQATPLETDTNESLKVLITRPEVKAQQLTLLLNQQGIANTSQPLFDYQSNASANDIATALKHADILIFVSVAAVEFTQLNYPLSNSVSQRFFAVGNATKQALHAIGITEVSTPPSQQEHSEGLLKLSQLTKIKNKKVVIFRGNGGREHIANNLRQRGAKVSYIESYQRVWRTLPINIAQQWRAQQINCIVITSNDILLALVKYLANTTESTDHFWQSQCLWLVVSERIEKNAKALGLKRVINAHSASSQILCNTLQTLSCS
ncbi:uroporphyrinogen-III synthase [Colwellia piezophila]|uniref:uroporphyrinogen-III synthase n=1 Tax=Colwellia piezophila TaxID=211668 RepID=UPI00036DA07F|nr:uroporphyrinogen-III synthase [Colwellia piezophila]